MKLKLIFIIGCLQAVFCSCSKEFLEEKPSTSIATPNSLEILTKLLDNELQNTSTSYLEVLSSDEYYFAEGTLLLDVVQRNGYLWKPDLYEGTQIVNDWNLPYSGVRNANVALEEIQKGLNAATSKEKEFLRSWALFVRARSFFRLVETFSPVYSKTTANTDLGVPLKLTPNVDEIKQRSTVQQTYDQILRDLDTALPGLNEDVDITSPNRPSKAATYSLLARVYMAMSDYENANKAAGEALKIHNKLVNFNSIQLPNNTPFKNHVDEIIYASHISGSVIPLPSLFPYICIDSALYKGYDENDLRKRVYFKLNSNGKPNLNQTSPYSIIAFSGFTTSELYLIKAECEVRSNNVTKSIEYLNLLLANRYKTGTYQPITSIGSADLLDKILLERRKELIFRGVRWGDLKRLNLEGRNITLTRKFNGQTYTLPPNSPLYVFPIPDQEVSRSSLQQNKR